MRLDDAFVQLERESMIFKPKPGFIQKDVKCRQQDFKRNIAYKLRIGDLLVGKPVIEGDKFIFLELGDRRIVRVNLIGNVIEKYNSTNEKRYSFRNNR